ncbi:DUF3159 domain-containing protein [Nonomuraea angiospora]|uniref:DUF3159 domain-containing protein n=1 Tax=Nonomuraea jabiensis TaxID=882448 RepID=A0A7W9LIJ1_9ACTN|nr:MULTISPECIES: DUF3159 domain-containing protein [Nonomuraea]MBB5784994.1 hypothetical protein [Nonomuraea jabiensis]MDX3108209.1 DUF3159 domain-containing protein [Nonomuraea angiospora]
MSAEAEEVAHDTVEAAVRAQLAKAFGGVRGIIEAAIPTIAFTVCWITTEELKLSLIVSVSIAVVLLLVRIVQRSTPQFVINSLIGIAIGAFFASRTGDAKDYFLPGILWNAGYMVAMLLSIVTRWPVVGFLIGSVTGDPTAWHKDPGIVKLCTRLTWLLLLPCAVRVAVQGPVYWFGGGNEAVAALGVAKIAMGWPLQVAALGAMLWVLGRGRTPIKPPVAPA